MDNSKTHEDQAKSNYSLLKDILLRTKYKDWKITVAFYTALHVMECQLIKKNPDWRRKNFQRNDPTSQHAWRSTCVSSLFKDVALNYRMLEERSKTARYLENTSEDKIANDVISEKDTKQCIDVYLKGILKKFNYNW